MKKKTIITAVIAAAAALTAGTASLFIVSSNQAFSAAVNSGQEISEKNSENYLSEHNASAEELTQKWEHSSEGITYLSDNGNSIFIYHTCIEEYKYDNATMILIPPLGYDYTVMLPQADYFLEKGFNTVIYDQRMSGRNNGDSFTFGKLEATDLSAVIEYLGTTTSSELVLSLYTEGSASFTAAYYLSTAYENLIDFAVFENPYPDAVSYIREAVGRRDYLIPEKTAEKLAVSKINSKFGINCEEINCLEMAGSINIPCLVLSQTGCDTYDSSYGKDFFDSLFTERKILAESPSENYSSVFYEDRELFEDSVGELIISLYEE